MGQWTGVQTWPVEAIHTTLLPTGKVMFWQTLEHQHRSCGTPTTGRFPRRSTRRAITTSSARGTPGWRTDGCWWPGGHVENALGSHRADIYNPFTNTWANSDPAVPNVPNMGPNDATPTGDQATSGRRWYPSATTLGNGDVLVLSGDVGPVSLWTHEPPYPDISGRHKYMGNAQRGPAAGPTIFLPEYPRSVSDAGRSRRVDRRPEQRHRILESHRQRILDVPVRDARSGLHNYGPAVMYDVGKIAQIGGGTIRPRIFRSARPQPAESAVDLRAQDMAQPRRQNNATILADGTVLITGGSSKSGFNDHTGFIPQAELWDPGDDDGHADGGGEQRLSRLSLQRPVVA